MNSISVSIVVSDPWDVGETTNWQPIQGALFQVKSDEQTNKALLKFSQPIYYHNVIYNYAVVVPRHRAIQLKEFCAGKTIPCVITGISDEQAKSDNPLDISKWRGGLAFDADVKPMQ